MTEAPIAPGSSFDTLRQLHRWVGWRWEVRKGVKTKPPYSPSSGRYASVSDPRTWGSHDEALAMLTVDGIGIVITGHPNIAACDLDHCRDPVTGTLAAWAQALIDRAGTYVEITPSHTGLRIVGLAQTGEHHFQIPKGANGEKVEVYAGGAGRFITVTEDVLVDRPLADITPVVESLIAEHAGTKNGAKTSTHDPGANGADLEGLSAEVVELIRDGAPDGADRSQMLFRAIAAMRAAGWPRIRIIATLRLNPAGIAAKCFDTGRDDVARQVDMVLRKIDDERAARRTKAKPAASTTAQAATTPAVGEDALALEFAERHDGHFVYDHTAGEWFRWNSEIWKRDSDQYVLDCVRVLIREHRLGQIRTAASVERAARTDRRLARDHTAWNTDPLLLGTPGDVVDLRDGELLAADAAHMINLATGVRPAPQGTPHPLWNSFLDDATSGDKALQRYLRQRAGYWCTGCIHREDFDFFWGPGGSGKGTFLHTITSILGDYAKIAPIAQFMTSKTEAHLCELARLADARLVVASEPEENRAWATGKIKALTGNEGRIAARHMHQNFFEFRPHFKLAFAGNSKPRINAVDTAIARRLNLVPFQFQPTKRDEHLKEKLEVEYPAILRWAIDGWLDMQAEGPVRPAVIVSATKEYLDDENVLVGWLTERCEFGPLHEILLKNLFADWKAWCEAAGEDPETNRKLKRRLERLPGLRFAHGKYGVSVKGIQIKS